jgi:hypothetical protein
VHNFSYEPPDAPTFGTSITRVAEALGLVILVLTTGAAAQDAKPPKETIKGGYVIHQSMDLGGHIADYSGSRAMYDTLVNLQSGPRILGHSLDMHAVGKTPHPFFDTLMMSNTGYGGDPNNFTMLRMSKGKLYDFQGLFRRDRQYFDYDLFDNPLIPAGVISNGYTFPQVQQSPHLFNTVRRMTDVNVTVLPLSRVSFRAGYSQNINQGPSYSSQHNGADALYLQNWRNSTDSWLGALDWKPFSKTTLTIQEYVTHYKGNTNWQLAGLNLQLSDGTPVTLGFDNVSAPNCGDGNPAIVNSSTTPATANATCPGYIRYSRYEPTRTLFPTEEFRFQSSSIKNIQMNGRVRYTGASMNIPHHYENFYGLDNMGLRSFTTTGIGKAERVSVTADYGIVLKVSEKISLSDQFDFRNFRQPADSDLSEVDQTGTSMLAPPDPASPAVITSAHNFLGMKTETNTVTVGFRASSKASISLGYRFRSRSIGFVMPLSTDALPNGTAYTFDIHENGGRLAAALRPTRQWRINASVEATYANKAYTQISPRALQHYELRATYKPKDWATISGSFNDLERRNSVLNVNHLDHSRSASIGASLMPNEHYGLELSYGYIDIFSRTELCYAATSAPAGAAPSPADCGTNAYLGNGYYDAPTQYGSIGIRLAPIKRFHSTVGYRMSAVSGAAEFLNPLQVPGSLQSQYQSPYAKVAWTLSPGWEWRGDWNYYGYGEGGLVGPTLTRTFRGNVYTLGVHYEF